MPARASLLSLAVTALSIGGIACQPTVNGVSRPAELAHVRRIAVVPFTVPQGAPPALSRSMADDFAARLAGSFRVTAEPGSPDAGGRGDVDGLLLGTVVEYRDRASTPDADTALGVTVRLVDAQTRDVVLSASSEASAAASFCADDMACLRDKVTGRLASWMVEQAGDRAVGAAARASGASPEAPTPVAHPDSR